MKGCQYIAKFLAKHNVTDVFGIPGGVVLDLLYAIDNQEGIIPHLNYHEQAAGFAAIGYAQASGRLGVAYATRGPGFTNLITPIAEAYCESIPVLFITGHTTPIVNSKMRVMLDQEIDTYSIVRNITKYACRIDKTSELAGTLSKAYQEAMYGRKGPVLLDVATRVLNSEIEIGKDSEEGGDEEVSNEDYSFIADAIKKAERPVLLIGDGVNQAQKQQEVKLLADRIQIPMLSSRSAHDILCDSEYYFGYIGSHGIRYANFVLSKADLIVSLGNRLHFPIDSASYSKITEKAKIIRIDIDSSEFERMIPNSQIIEANLNNIVDKMLAITDLGNHQEWIGICKILESELNEEDINTSIHLIEAVLDKIPNGATIVSDVGNNEFWLSRACVHKRYPGRVLYSKSFGSLGCGLCKSIGTYYATQKPVMCFIGDQGLQLNLQELQYIAQHRLPILIALINNSASGMIKDREQSKYGRYIHTTINSGYGHPDFAKLAEAFGLSYINNVDQLTFSLPCVLDLQIDSMEKLTPYLPMGRFIQDMVPELDRNKLEKLNKL